MIRITATFFLSALFLIAKAQDSTLQSAANYIFFPGNDITIPPGGAVTLGIKQLVNDIPEDVMVNQEQWTIDGRDLSRQNEEEGSFKPATLQPDKGVYTAPAKVPPSNPVLITLSFQSAEEKTRIILYCRVHVIDKENYFYLNNHKAAGGTLYELKESPVPSLRRSGETAFYINNQWNIGINGFRKSETGNSNPEFMGMSVSIVENGTGTYKWTVNGNDKTGLTPPCDVAIVSGKGKDGSPFQYISADCVPHGDDNCKLVTLDGSTTITVFDKKNKRIKGYFSGILASATHEFVSVSGAFSVYIQ